ncbi:uncharacterized protein LOC143896078 isoform X4 [Temnothorax americanus]|uniref:uncharacterized protein LOC143896078 isoform X4 n=1 Tax=Temnothorax americanus TaxID=1964332 RepID=UPI0040684C93
MSRKLEDLISQYTCIKKQVFYLQITFIMKLFSRCTLQSLDMIDLVIFIVKCSEMFVCPQKSFDVLDSIKKSLVADVPKIILHHISQPMCCKTSSPASQINENTQEIIINLISSNSSELNNENHVVDCNENIVNNIIKDKSTTVTINNTEHVSDHTEYMYGQNETENILIQEQIGLTTETECHITTDNIQHNTESLNEDIVQTNSANILWNWNGNTLQVYEAADTNILPCTTSKNTAETYRRVSTEDSDEFRISTEREISYSDNDAENEQNITNMEKQKNKKKKTKKKDKKELLSHTNHTRKIKWTESAKRVVLDAFGYYLEKKDAKLQGSEIAKLIKKHRDILGNRTVPTIRTWLHNQKRDKFKI